MKQLGANQNKYTILLPTKLYIKQLWSKKGLGGLAFKNNQILFWSVSFKLLLNRYNKPTNYFNESDSASIQNK